MLGFDTVTLPDGLTHLVRRETRFRTDIVTTASGHENRNAAWLNARRHYVMEAGAVSLTLARQLEAFYIARRGRHRGFYLADWLHPHSGDGATPTAEDIALVPRDKKRRDYGLSIAGRGPIFPLADGFVLARNGKLLRAETDYRLDIDKAQIRLKMAAKPSDMITAGFYFLTAVRFDADRLDIERVSDTMARIGAVPLIEINGAEAVA